MIYNVRKRRVVFVAMMIILSCFSDGCAKLVVGGAIAKSLVRTGGNGSRQ
jgi:hypothetical protein